MNTTAFLPSSVSSPSPASVDPALVAQAGPSSCDRVIAAAAQRLGTAVRRTPCERSPGLSAETGLDVFLKREDLQVTGSFKERGACHALLQLSEEERRAGVIASSAGNHALGLAFHGRRLGVPVTLVMPRNATTAKVTRCRELGAEVVLHGRSFDEANDASVCLAQERGARRVHPFDDSDVIAGQGTLAWEALQDVSSAEAVVVPVGGGGLLAGVTLAVRALLSSARVIAVEPAAATSLRHALKNGGPTATAVRPTLADGLAVAKIGLRPYDIFRHDPPGVVDVTESEISYAMLRLFEAERAIVEGAGASALAAVLAAKTDLKPGAKVVVLVSGGNVDAATFSHALQAGAAQRRPSPARFA